MGIHLQDSLKDEEGGFMMDGIHDRVSTPKEQKVGSGGPTSIGKGDSHGWQ